MLAKLVLLCAVTGALAGLKWGSVNQTDSKENPEPDSSDLGMERTEISGSDVESKERLPWWLFPPPPPPPVWPYNPYPPVGQIPGRTPGASPGMTPGAGATPGPAVTPGTNPPAVTPGTNPPGTTSGADFIRYRNYDFKQDYVLNQEHDPSIQDPWKCWTVTKERGFNAMSYSTVHRGCYFKNVPVPFPGATALDPWQDGFCQVKT
ncbi:unnamed protein product [Effrenium voratum]|uniref:Uncharacterized protein n=1 Tax=Effrenium voratum TaxID=2562239 RepID=A0AA36ISS9_9DINO|nr:unnamed protein product [Effrenium voratum]CAJ1421450.1 unnamed protein product [Effrenium voratum]